MKLTYIERKTRNMCVQCSNPTSGKVLCDKCRARRKELSTYTPIYGSVGDTIKCPLCGTEFVKLQTRHKYCSNKCRSALTAIRQQERYIAKGGCIRCGSTEDMAGKSYCRACYQKTSTKGQGISLYRLQRYGLTPQQIDAMLLSQGDVCAICKQSGKMHVDHDHATNLIRGMLCEDCNRGLGSFRDNPESLKNAIDYLEEAALLNALDLKAS